MSVMPSGGLRGIRAGAPAPPCRRHVGGVPEELHEGRRGRVGAEGSPRAPPPSPRRPAHRARPPGRRPRGCRRRPRSRPRRVRQRSGHPRGPFSVSDHRAGSRPGATDRLPGPVRRPRRSAATGCAASGSTKRSPSLTEPNVTTQIGISASGAADSTTTRSSGRGARGPARRRQPGPRPAAARRPSPHPHGPTAHVDVRERGAEAAKHLRGKRHSLRMRIGAEPADGRLHGHISCTPCGREGRSGGTTPSSGQHVRRRAGRRSDPPRDGCWAPHCADGLGAPARRVREPGGPCRRHTRRMPASAPASIRRTRRESARLRLPRQLRRTPPCACAGNRRVCVHPRHLRRVPPGACAGKRCVAPAPAGGSLEVLPGAPRNTGCWDHRTHFATADLCTHPRTHSHRGTERASQETRSGSHKALYWSG